MKNLKVKRNAKTGDVLYWAITGAMDKYMFEVEVEKFFTIKDGYWYMNSNIPCEILEDIIYRLNIQLEDMVDSEEDKQDMKRGKEIANKLKKFI